jgi:phage gpG-like protein
VSVTIEVIQKISGGEIFADLIAKASDLSPAMAEVENILSVSTNRHFAEESDANGSPWAALAAYTIKRREQRGYGAGPKLRASGDFFNSIATASGANFAEIGTPLAYPGYHMTGTSRMPARVWLGLSTADENDIYNVFAKYLIP